LVAFAEFDSGSGRIFLKFVECVSQDEKWDVCRVCKSFVAKVAMRANFWGPIFLRRKIASRTDKH
jgi:hypothetical protein